MGSVQSIVQVKNIITKNDEPKIVVCSAMSGVTNQLLEVTKAMRNSDKASLAKNIKKLKDHHEEAINGLRIDEKAKKSIKNKISNIFEGLTNRVYADFSEELEGEVVTFGEMLSSQLLSGYLQALGVDNALLLAKDFMYTDELGNPEMEKIETSLKRILNTPESEKLYITQGYVCRDPNGKVCNLGRGGSDYSGAIIGAALSAKEVQIWTDIDGVHNNDPRYVDETSSISFLSYQEASSLAYFGAKVLHPQTVQPLIEKQIPLRLKNTFDPTAPGTTIANAVSSAEIKAIASKGDMAWIGIKNSSPEKEDELFVKVFSILKANKVSVEMMSSSENVLSLVIEKSKCTRKLIDQLEQVFEVDVAKPTYCVVCLAGTFVMKDPKIAMLFKALNSKPVKMISFGVDGNHLLLLVKKEDKVKTLKLLHDKLFLVPEEETEEMYLEVLN